MKKIFLLISITLLSLSANAQDDAITKFFGKYAEDESFTQVTVTSRMFGLFANLDAEDAENKELLEAVSKVKGLRILAKDEISQEEADALYAEAIKLIPVKQYDELMTIKDQESDMKFLIKEENNIIAELLMLIHSNNSFFLLSLIGDIDLNQISKLSKSMSIDGFENLEKINGQNKN